MKKKLSQLLSECVQNNEKAWKTFIEKYHRLISGTVFKYAYGQDVDDTVQLVYERLIEKNYHLLKQFQGDSEAAFIIYLKRISQNIAYSQFRSKSRADRHINGSDKDLNGFADGRIGQEASTLDSMESDEIGEAIMRLDINSREIIFLRMQGYKFKEIAKIIDAPLNTVLTQFDRAKKKLKNFLPQEIIS